MTSIVVQLFLTAKETNFIDFFLTADVLLAWITFLDNKNLNFIKFTLLLIFVINQFGVYVV